MAFRRFLHNPSFVITSYELRDSGFIDTLFVCFAASACSQWNRSVSGDTQEDHLNYLLERRNLFIHLFYERDELKTLFRLLIDTVEEIASFPIYLPELIFQMNLIKSPATACYQNYAGDILLLQGRALESSVHTKALEIMEQWFNIIPKDSDLSDIENYLICKEVNMTLQNFDTNEVTYL
ncbi:unnamed protein product, partial [Hymenolepis diminuta]